MKHVVIFKYRNSDQTSTDSFTFESAVAFPRRGDIVSAGAGPDAEVSSVQIHYESNQVNVIINLDADTPYPSLGKES